MLLSSLSIQSISEQDLLMVNWLDLDIRLLVDVSSTTDLLLRKYSEQMIQLLYRKQLVVEHSLGINSGKLLRNVLMQDVQSSLVTEISGTYSKLLEKKAG